MNNVLFKYQQKRCDSLTELRSTIEVLKSQGHKIVLTSGTFDILHVGHVRYLSIARSLGDRLIVGLDSDEKVRARKGPNRPVVDQNERAEMLTYLEAVDWLYVKQLEDPHWGLIKAVSPDVLVISKRSEYSEDEITQLSEFCGKVTVLESQAETSTTGRIRSLIISSVSPLLGEFDQLEERIKSMREQFENIMGKRS